MPKSPAADAKAVQLVRDLTDILEDAGLVELEYNTENVSIRLSKAAAMAAPVAAAPAPAPAAAAAPAPAAAPEAEAEIDLTNAITSPMVGTVYLSPEPGAAQFVSEGDSVKAGQTLLIVEAMKVMNPITAQKGGVVRSILVGDAQPVEFGEPLVIID
ncbi:MAG: acetyl-CoA carboxylase biotin carboxyl carrier protein [Candidatus Puniceispirillales bacterium]